MPLTLRRLPNARITGGHNPRSALLAEAAADLCGRHEGSAARAASSTGSG